MKVKCMVCGKEIDRKHPGKLAFCTRGHMYLWMREHVDFSKLSKRHKAPNLTELNRVRNPLCHIADRGNANSRLARKTAEAHLGRQLMKGEVVHHMNGSAEDNRPENLLVMPAKQHKQLHMAIAMERMEGENPDEK